MGKNNKDAPWPERDGELRECWRWRDADGRWYECFELEALMRLTKGQILGRAKRLELPSRKGPNGRLGQVMRKRRDADEISRIIRPASVDSLPPAPPRVIAAHDVRAFRLLPQAAACAIAPPFRVVAPGKPFSMLGGTLQGTKDRATRREPPVC